MSNLIDRKRLIEELSEAGWSDDMTMFVRPLLAIINGIPPEPAPSPALTREALAAALLATTQEVTDAGYTHGKEDWADAQADAILSALAGDKAEAPR